MYYVYIIKSSKTRKLYIGYTDDLRKRFMEHNRGKSTATKSSAPFELVYYEAYCVKKDAFIRERQLKRYKQAYSRLKERIKFSLTWQN